MWCKNVAEDYFVFFRVHAFDEQDRRTNRFWQKERDIIELDACSKLVQYWMLVVYEAGLQICVLELSPQLVKMHYF